MLMKEYQNSKKQLLEIESITFDRQHSAYKLKASDCRKYLNDVRNPLCIIF